MGLPLPLREMRSIPCIFADTWFFKGMTKPNKLHQAATRYVSARAQASLIESMLEQEILAEKRLEIYKRGRNTNSHTKAKMRMSDLSHVDGLWGCHGLSPYDGGVLSSRRADWLVHPASRRRKKAVKNIREWFPHAEVTDQANPPAGYVAIPLQAHQWMAAEGRRANRARKNNWFPGWVVKKRLPLILGTSTRSMEREKPLKSSKNAARLLPPLAFNSRRDGFLVRDDADTLAQLSGSLATEWTGLCTHSRSRAVAGCSWYLKDTVSAMEYDFNIRLSIMVGLSMDWVKSWESISGYPSRTGRLRAWIRERSSRCLSLFSTLSVGNRGRQIWISLQSRQVCISWLKVKINCKTSLLLFGTMGQL